MSKTPKLNMICPVEGCSSRHGTVHILAHHIAMSRLNAAHNRWMVENGIENTPRPNEELVNEIEPILESRQRYNRSTKQFEF